MFSLAQIQKGKRFVSGDLNVGSQRGQSAEKRSQLNLNLSAGYLLTNNVAVGGALGYLSSTTDVRGASTIMHTNDFRLGAFVRRYFLLDENLYLYVEGQVYASYFKYFQDDHGVRSMKSTDPAFGADLTPTAMYFVGKKVALQASIGRIHFDHRDEGGGWKANVFSASFGLRALTVGASIYF